MRNTRTSYSLSAGLLALSLLLPRPATAAWPTDPTVNVPVCTATGERQTTNSVSDGAGGAIVAWFDYGGDGNVRAQRISVDGTVQWTADGVALCTAPSVQQWPGIVSDNAGGAIVTWIDYRSGSADIYAQRISAGGVVQWAADGVALCTAAGGQEQMAVALDGTGGAIATWIDSRGTDLDIYAQRISATGAVQWTTDGVALCTATGGQRVPKIVSDCAGGAIVAWDDQRSGYPNSEVYAQRISAAGTVQWATDGVILCTATPDRQGINIVSDGAGGAIVAWEDFRNDLTYHTACDIYSQRISAAGTVQWATDGVALCTATGGQYTSGISSDGAGGAIVTWQDYRDWRSDPGDIYAQRISAAGTVQWTANGAALCTATSSQEQPAIIADGAGGAIVTWQDYRSGTNFDIYAQRISAGGAVQWSANGVALCTATGGQHYPTIASDGTGGAIVAWWDQRSGASGNDDIYAQRVQANGQLGGEAWADVPPAVPLAFALDPVHPNPMRGGAVTVRFTLPSSAAASIELLDIAGRLIAAREVGSFGAGRHTLDLGEGRKLAPGLYLVCLRQDTSTRVKRVVVLK